MANLWTRISHFGEREKSNLFINLPLVQRLHPQPHIEWAQKKEKFILPVKAFVIRNLIKEFNKIILYKLTTKTWATIFNGMEIEPDDSGTVETCRKNVIRSLVLRIFGKIKFRKIIKLYWKPKLDMTRAWMTRTWKSN